MITLRPYQTEAAHKLWSILAAHRIAYLRGEVRTGKTLTAFETARLLEVTKVLVVTKKKAIPSIVNKADVNTATDVDDMPF